MSLEPGARLGPYEIITQIGEGGMGEVYRARDISLDREVAIKVLPAEFASDPERLARFEREAKVLASLNHPNIAHIHGLERSGDAPALILELVEGPTLHDRIAQGAVPLEEALPIARQIAEALEAAHERGIIHRDLKPANIKVTPEGVVKVLDFGLAKALEPERTEADIANSPTMSMTHLRQGSGGQPAAATKMGMILGTAAYMSPEQARGKPVDRRTDIWAFGVVLFEMLTGRKAFEGDDVSLTLSSVLRLEPDWTAIPTDLPSVLTSFLRRCLEKDPKRRIRDIGDVRLAIEGAFDVEPRIAKVVPASPWMRPESIVVAAVLSAAIGAFVMWSLAATRDDVVSPAVARFSLALDPAFPLRLTAAYPDLAVTPDGSRVVYLSGGNNRTLAVRKIGDLTASVLVEEGVRISAPFIGANADWVGYFDDTTIKRVPITGGTPTVVVDAGDWPRGADWAADGTIVFATREAGTGLFRVPSSGGAPEVLTRPDSERGEIGHWWPTWLPDNRGVVFTLIYDVRAQAETARVALLDLEAGTWREILPSGSSARYVASGHLVYVDRGALWAVPFDLDRRSVSGSPVELSDESAGKGTGAANMAVSTDGALWYVRGAQSEFDNLMLSWVDQRGSTEAVLAEQRDVRDVRLSPSADRVAVELRDGEWDIWVGALPDPVLTRLTFDPGPETDPLWTPDGQRIIFTSDRDGPSNLFSVRADGTGEPVRLTDSRSQQTATSISPDGATLIFNDVDPRLRIDVGALRLDQPERAPELILDSPFRERNAEISPNGRWLADQSDESGRDEIYLREFSGVDRPRARISTTGGLKPFWSRDGRQLFSWNQTELHVIPIDAESGARTGPSRLVLDAGGRFNVGPEDSRRRNDVSLDAERFLVLGRSGGVAPDDAPERSIIVVQHWIEELKALVPSGQ